MSLLNPEVAVTDPMYWRRRQNAAQDLDLTWQETMQVDSGNMSPELAARVKGAQDARAIEWAEAVDPTTLSANEALMHNAVLNGGQPTQQAMDDSGLDAGYRQDWGTGGGRDSFDLITNSGGDTGTVNYNEDYQFSPSDAAKVGQYDLTERKGGDKAQQQLIGATVSLFVPAIAPHLGTALLSALPAGTSAATANAIAAGVLQSGVTGLQGGSAKDAIVTGLKVYGIANIGNIVNQALKLVPFEVMETVADGLEGLNTGVQATYDAAIDLLPDFGEGTGVGNNLTDYGRQGLEAFQDLEMPIGAFESKAAYEQFQDVKNASGTSGSYDLAILDTPSASRPLEGGGGTEGLLSSQQTSPEDPYGLQEYYRNNPGQFGEDMAAQEAQNQGMLSGPPENTQGTSVPYESDGMPTSNSTGSGLGGEMQAQEPTESIDWTSLLGDYYGPGGAGEGTFAADKAAQQAANQGAEGLLTGTSTGGKGFEQMTAQDLQDAGFMSQIPAGMGTGGGTGGGNGTGNGTGDGSGSGNSAPTPPNFSLPLPMPAPDGSNSNNSYQPIQQGVFESQMQTPDYGQVTQRSLLDIPEYSMIAPSVLPASNSGQGSYEDWLKDPQIQEGLLPWIEQKKKTSGGLI